MSDSNNTFYRDRRPHPTAEMKATRKAAREAAAALAMAELEERQRVLRANMDRLKSERLATANQPKRSD